MVELAVGPYHRIMTLLAGRRKADVVHRSGGRVVIVLVTTDAGRARQVVVVVDVAIGAQSRRYGMRSG